jgi:hypothetical protein
MRSGRATRVASLIVTSALIATALDTAGRALETVRVDLSGP